MDKAEQIAADIALTMNGGEWKDGKWYSNGHREAWIKAVQPYADEIERLQDEIFNLETEVHFDDQTIKSLQVINERLREALKLMVDEKCEYMILNLLGDPEQQHTIKIARAALKGDE